MITDIVSTRASDVNKLNTENLQTVQTKNVNKLTSERVALKPLNQNIGRVQPFRVAKQNATKQGFFSQQSSSLNKKETAPVCDFKIFNEEVEKIEKICKKTSVKASVPSKPFLHPALTSLPVARVPLSTLHIQDTPSTSQESFSKMDVSEEERLNIFDIDSDTFGFSEYAVDIFKHLREVENLRLAKPNYMRKQHDITVLMRSILVDWLIEVAEEFRLLNETVYLAVNYIDRFLSQMAVLRGKLQLVGTSAMFIAAKFEEIYPPDVGEFVYITDETYTKKQVLRMEHLILKVLKFDLVVPTANQFLKRYLLAAKADKKTEYLAQYLCELALIEFDCIRFLPSILAASAVCLASFSVAGKIWDETMEFYMNYKLDDLKACIQRLHEINLAANDHPQQAVPEKYKNVKFDSVADYKLPEALPFDDKDESLCTS